MKRALPSDALFQPRLKQQNESDSEKNLHFQGLIFTTYETAPMI
jgi:hypothetical protein